MPYYVAASGTPVKNDVSESHDILKKIAPHQYPDELAKLLIFLYQHKISSFCEMGVAFGGTFFVIDSFLRAVNPEMKYSLAINSYSDRSFKKKLEVYQKEHPEVTFLEMDAREFIPDKKYDFCFIDYEHTAENCRISYNAMKKYSNFIGFHDIKYRRYPDVVKFWDEEVAGDKVELLNEDPIFPEPIGIGIVTNFA